MAERLWLFFFSSPYRVHLAAHHSESSPAVVLEEVRRVCAMNPELVLHEKTLKIAEPGEIEQRKLELERKYANAIPLEELTNGKNNRVFHQPYLIPGSKLRDPKEDFRRRFHALLTI